MIKLAETRGKKVLENSVFGSDDHITVTDRYGAYHYFNKDNRQICWAHLSRDFERFANNRVPERIHTSLSLKEVTALWKESFPLKSIQSTFTIGILKNLINCHAWSTALNGY